MVEYLIQTSSSMNTACRMASTPLQICGASPQWNLRNLGTNPSGYHHALNETSFASSSSKALINIPSLTESKIHGKCTPTRTEVRLVVKSHRIGSKIFTLSDKVIIEHGFAGLIWRGDQVDLHCFNWY
jgi:hypothetical protein